MNLSADGATVTARYSFNAIASDQVSSENSSIPVTVSVVEGPTVAIEGIDFIIPQNQSLDMSSTSAVNQIEVQIKGDNFNDDGDRIIVIVTIPDDIPVHFQTNIAGATMRKSLRIKIQY